jgi:predicted extracellular nuclease
MKALPGPALKIPPAMLKHVAVAHPANESRRPRLQWFACRAIVLLAPLAFATPTFAAVLAGWDVHGLAGGINSFGASPLAATISDANLTVGGLTRGSGVGTTGTAAARAWGGNTWTSANAAAAVTSNQYASFTVRANAGYQVSFDSISKFDYRRSSTGAVSGTLQYQVGGSAFTDIGTVSYTSSSSSGASIATPISLSGIGALQNVAAGTTVTFRVVNYGASGSGGTWYVFDTANTTANDFEISGSVSPAGGGADVPPTVYSTSPANGATGVAVSSTVSVTFSEAVTAASNAFTLSCGTSGSHSFVLSGGPTTFTLNPDTNFANSETCTGTVVAANVTDQDGTPDTMAANYGFSFTTAGAGGGGTPIYQIQGSGTTSPLVGQVVATSGIVTRVNNNGFFLQDPAGDGNANTSDGIFVFTSSAPTVTVGQSIQLSGTVTEFNVGSASNADTLAHKVTELTSPTGITVVSSGNSIAPLAVSLPEAVNDELEKYEGMLVTLTGPLTASQNYFQGRYGQVTLSVGGRMETPTNKYRPNTAQAIDLADENARRRIILDDGTSVQNPNPTPYIGLDNTLRAGDTVDSVTGVIDYGLATNDNTNFGDYKVHPTQTVAFTRANPRSATPDAVGGNIKVASFNVLNYFTTFTDGTTATGQTGQGCSQDGAVSAANCRGADTSSEFTRQRNKIVAAIQAINADVVGLMEIQNNGNTAAQNLVSGLNAAMGAGTYAVLPLPAEGTGTDAIRVAMIYKPAAVTLVGNSMSDTDAINNRPTLLQKFAAPNGQQFTVAVNHMKSKGSCPASTSDVDADQGDGQGCWNNRRTLQAQRLRTWVAANGTADALLIGDFNAYGQEDPIFELTSHGYVDQVGAFNSFGYSYVFDGAAGRLDHAISTASMGFRIANVKHWHINADEPSVIDYNLEFKQPACGTCGPDYFTATAYRSSDHDPVVVGLNLNDLDGDGLTDAQEAALGTSSSDWDSDDDGLADGTEDANHNGVVDPGETNPANADTDGDGIQDGTELGITTPIADPDGAGPLLGTNTAIFVADADPLTTTSPTNADSDGDGYSDGVEDANHTGRVDAGESNPADPSSVPASSGPVQVPALPRWALAVLAAALPLVGRKARR